MLIIQVFRYVNFWVEPWFSFHSNTKRNILLSAKIWRDPNAKDAILTLTVISRIFIPLFRLSVVFCINSSNYSRYTRILSFRFSSLLYYRNSQFPVLDSRWSYILLFIIYSVIIVIKFTLHSNVKILHLTKINADSCY